MASRTLRRVVASAIIAILLHSLGMVRGDQPQQLTSDLLRSSSEAFLPNPPPGTVVVVRANVVDNGDQDPWADTNETIQMTLTLYNRTDLDLTGLVATLSTEDPKVACIPHSTLEVGRLTAREIRTTEAAFTLVIGEVSRVTAAEDFSVQFEVAMSADQLESLPVPEKIAIDLDLDATGGAQPTTFFESFEGAQFGAFGFTIIDDVLNPPPGDL